MCRKLAGRWQPQAHIESFDGQRFALHTNPLMGVSLGGQIYVDTHMETHLAGLAMTQELQNEIKLNNLLVPLCVTTQGRMQTNLLHT